MPSIAPVLDDVLAVFAAAYGYDDEQLQRERDRVSEAIRWVSTFEPAPSPAPAA
jgi:hypothetical protein